MNGTTVFFDLETGGVEAEHPIIQVAAVAVRGWQEVEVFEAKVFFNPEDADPDALALNGYTHQAWAGAEEPDDVARELAEFFARHADWHLTSKAGRPYRAARMAGHNVEFDVPRLRAMMDAAKTGFWKGAWYYAQCTKQLALWTYAGRDDAPPNYQLQTLGRHLGIGAKGAEHEALADVRLTIAVAKALINLRATPSAAYTQDVGPKPTPESTSASVPTSGSQPPPPGSPV